MPLQGPPLERTVNLLDLLHVELNSKPDDLALVSTETSWTYHELDRDSNRLAANLLGLRLRKGDRVASLLPNHNVLIVHYIACLKAGLVVVPLNDRHTGYR
jgi:acyl-CoA synthetase (AMP-forming)/AMP-acid ligase II